MPRRAVAAVVAVTLLVAGPACSDDDSEKVQERRPGSAGCAEPTLETGLRTLEVEGVAHEYLLFAPEDQDVAAPVIVDLHGRGSNARQQELFSGLGMAGLSRGFVVATPTSTHADRHWALPTAAAGRDSTDAQLVGALLDELEARLCIDPTREYAAGASNGAGLAAGLLCALPGRLAGIAPVAGVNLLAPCTEAEPTTIVAFHGTADAVVPYEGGALQLRDLVGGDLQPVEQVIAEWSGLFHCAGDVEEQVAPDVNHRTYRGCDDGVTVELYTVEGGGHTWPGGTPAAILGPTTTSISATDLILDAFSG